MSDVSISAPSGEVKYQSSAGIDDNDKNPVFNAVDDGDTKPSSTVQIDHGEDAKPSSNNRIDRSTDIIDATDPNDNNASTVEAKKPK
jgi:hypothetical protein